MNKSQFRYTMLQLYRMAGITKQAHYKRIKQQQKEADITQQVLSSASKIRQRHKQMGCRKLYTEIKPEGIGRDKTEAILLSNGLRVRRKRNYHRTTYAGKKWYPNRISGMSVTGINQLWVSDITYIPVANKHFYLTLVQDVYSRKITGWQLSSTMRSDQTVIPAYQEGIRTLTRDQRKGLIFHSDRGSQYGCDQLEGLHIKYKVSPSMGGKAWENAHAESINGVLKNEYINFEGMNVTLTQARKMMKNIIYLYNNERPHGSLKNRKPVEFENLVQQLTAERRPVFKINY